MKNKIDMWWYMRAMIRYVWIAHNMGKGFMYYKVTDRYTKRKNSFLICLN